MTWSLTAASRQAATLRIVSSPVLIVPSSLMAVAFAGQGVVLGLLIAVIPMYLAWVWVADLAAVARASRGAAEYRARPRYWLFALLSVLLLPAYWLWKWWTDPTWSFAAW